MKHMRVYSSTTFFNRDLGFYDHVPFTNHYFSSQKTKNNLDSSSGKS